MHAVLPTQHRTDAEAALCVRAPGRLHLGFLDPAGTLGRPFGSLGLVIDGFETEVELCAARADRIVVPEGGDAGEGERAARLLQQLRERTGLGQPLQLRLVQALPAHAGFGSGTQLALAVGRAFALWHGLQVDTPTLARWLGRGRRSGVGIAGFDQGGLLLDGGPGADGTPAPVLARLAMPAAWRVLVVQDLHTHGLAGAAEREALARLSPLPRAAAADICHQVLMQVLPGAAQGDFTAFASGLNRMQQVLGEHFAPAQGGSAFTSAAVGRLMHWVQHAGASALGVTAAVGQSSWGPTGFAILPSHADARAMVDAAQRAQAISPQLTLRIVAPRLQGAVITDLRERGDRR